MFRPFLFKTFIKHAHNNFYHQGPCMTTASWISRNMRHVFYNIKYRLKLFWRFICWLE